MTAPSEGELRKKCLANRAVPHMSHSQICTPEHISAQSAPNSCESPSSLGGFVQFGMAAVRSVWSDHANPVEPARWQLFAEMLGMGAVDLITSVASSRGFDPAEHGIEVLPGRQPPVGLDRK